jgi:hypothetical protein
LSEMVTVVSEEPAALWMEAVCSFETLGTMSSRLHDVTLHRILIRIIA